MSFITKYADKLVNVKDRVDTESYRKGTFFLLSVSLFLGVSIFFTLFFIFQPPPHQSQDDFIGMLMSNVALCLTLAALMFVYKKWGIRNILANVMMFFYYFGFGISYSKTGGIYSPDLIWVIIGPAWIFLIANKRSGNFWNIFSILLIVFFYYAERNGLRDFKADLNEIDSTYYFLSLIFAIPLMYFIIIVHQQNKEKYMQEVFEAKAEIETQKEDILSSINYAKRIQNAVLPHDEHVMRGIPLSFTHYKPRDIVSGDFYWFHEIDKDSYILAVADCTGHGVPGAFMTVIGSTLLNQIIIENKITQPSMILDALDRQVNSTLKQEKEHFNSVQDGMDLSIIRVNKAQKEFVYTSAKRPAIFIRNKELQEIKGSKFTIGGMRSGEKKFDEIKMNYQQDDMIYFFTDGITDQFGGEKGKKFTIKRLRELLLEIHRLPMNEQKQKLSTTIENWKGSLEQVDDILLMGIRF